MIPRYGKLNKIYTGIMSGDSFSFEKQQFISDFYREYRDTQTFETALISLMLEMDAAHYVVLMPCHASSFSLPNSSSPSSKISRTDRSILTALFLVVLCISFRKGRNIVSSKSLLV